MAVDRSKRFFMSVDSLTQEVDYDIPASGKVWKIHNVFGAANPNQDTVVCLVWDYQGAGEEILYTGYGSHDKKVNIDLTGDGTKKLAIVLGNNSLSSETLGISYEAIEK